MSEKYLVIGHFKDSGTAVKAVQAVKGAGYTDFKGYSPFPDHDFEDEIYKGKKRSPVRMFTLLGGMTGCLGAFLMTTWMSIDYPIRTSAKPLVSIPAFVVVAFECTILLGAIFTLLSMGHFSKVPNIFALLGGEPGFKPNFSSGTFGVVVDSSKEGTAKIEEILADSGAQLVEVDYVS